MKKQQIKSGSPKRRSWIIAAAIIVVLICASMLPEFAYQQNIAAMRGAIEDVKNDVVIPAGGVEKLAPTLIHGPHFYDKFTCIDTNCPQLESTWLVPLATEDIARFKSEVESRVDKIKSDGGMLSNREKWHVDVFADSTNETPYTAPTGKEWQNIHIFIYE